MKPSRIKDHDRETVGFCLFSIFDSDTFRNGWNTKLNIHYLFTFLVCSLSLSPWFVHSVSIILAILLIKNAIHPKYELAYMQTMRTLFRIQCSWIRYLNMFRFATFSNFNQCKSASYLILSWINDKFYSNKKQFQCLVDIKKKTNSEPIDEWSWTILIKNDSKITYFKRKVCFEIYKKPF